VDYFYSSLFNGLNKHYIIPSLFCYAQILDNTKSLHKFCSYQHTVQNQKYEKCTFALVNSCCIGCNSNWIFFLVKVFSKIFNFDFHLAVGHKQKLYICYLLRMKINCWMTNKVPSMYKMQPEGSLLKHKISKTRKIIGST
jgi:hypothetical protein